MKLYVKPGRHYRLAGKEYGPGDSVEGVPEKFLRVLTHSKGPLEQRQGATQAAVAPAAGGDDMTALRAQYREVVGRGPFNGWDAATLKQKIAEYRTTSMGGSPLTTHLTAR